MHILVVNDDGPPSSKSSPYVHSLVKTLQQAGHVVSVVLPHTQRSWIGKAHIIGQTVKPVYFRPGTLYEDDGTTHDYPNPARSPAKEEWVLVDGTPASCVQIGLYHYFHERGPVELVVSGPNYGRNSTAVFSLSSGTLGGALEAAICRRRAIALSYGFFSRNHDREIIAGASDLSLRLIEYLYKNWNENVDLYSINVPLVENVGQRKVLWTNMLQNYWGYGSCFEEEKAESQDNQELDLKETNIEDIMTEGLEADKNVTRHQHKIFKWAPRFRDVYKSVEDAPPGNDGWAVQNGYTSVTPLKANFMHAPVKTEGELKLPNSYFQNVECGFGSLSNTVTPHFFALINYEDVYVQTIILDALKNCLPKGSYTLIKDIADLPNPTEKFLQIGAYESLLFDHILTHDTSSLVNAYVIRKALIRKHYLNTTVYNWVTKKPWSILKTNVKISCDFEVDYAEFLEESLCEAWDLRDSFKNNSGKADHEREWWILKPGMSDCGQGIRLFSTEDELQAIFEEWEAQQSDLDEDEENVGSLSRAKNEEGGKRNNEFIVTSNLRHFIAQPYIHQPLLIEEDPRKFHIRTYVLAKGDLKVYVFQDMLALFSNTPYVPPCSSSIATDLSAHLTNTCLQTGTENKFVQLFSSLSLSDELKIKVFVQICEVVGELFEAAARGMMVHFQTIPNAFEIFGLDFLLDVTGRAWLLEVNAFPDFKQTGEELQGVIIELWESVVHIAVREFFGILSVTQGEEIHSKMKLVKDLRMKGY